MSIEKLEINYDGHTIRGLFYKPDTAREKYPLVVGCHGAGSKYEWLMEYAQQFCNAGACVAIYDFCGGGKESRSSDTTLDLSVMTEARDCKAVLSYYKAMDFIDTSRVYLLGESMGGMVATIVAAEKPEDFKAMMLLYPGYTMPDNARTLWPTKDSIPEEYDMGRMVVSKKFYEDLYDLDAYEFVAKIKCPVYILHGDADTVVPLSYSERALDVFEDAQMTVFPGLGHGFEGDDIVAAAEVFTEFLKENM